MNLRDLIVYFVTGGTFTALIVALEEGGQRTLSGLAALVPIFTLVAYIFIGQSQGGLAVSQHAKWVLVGTLVSWVPYMLAVAYFANKVGPQEAIIIGMGFFFVLALVYIFLTSRLGLFQ